MIDHDHLAGAPGPPRLRGLALGAVLTGLMITLFLEALDQMIVGLAMPQIVAELHGLDRYSWTVMAYILSSMTMIPIVGKLSDQFGRKGFLVVGTLLFLLGSALAGAAQSMNQLIAFRAVQGLGAGAGIALIGVVMADLFAPEQRARWSSLFGVVYGLASLLGPTIGGWLTEHGPLLGGLVTPTTRWRWVFFINLPVGLVAVAALLVFLPARTAAPGECTGALRRVDVPGALLCAAATISLMLGLTWGGTHAGWTSPAVLLTLAAGAVLLVGFLLVERAAREPILPLGLFRNPVFCSGAALTLLQNMMVMGLTLYLPLFFQSVFSISPAAAGLVMTPLSISMVVGAVAGSLALDRFKRYRGVAIAAALLMCVGTLLIAGLNPRSSIPAAIGYMVLAGAGSGVFFTLPMVAVQNALPGGQLGVGTAALRYLGLVGATLGIAIVGTVVSSAAAGDLLSGLPAGDTGRLALAAALQQGFRVVLVFAVLVLATACLLRDRYIAASRAMEAQDGAPQEPSPELLRA